MHCECGSSVPNVIHVLYTTKLLRLDSSLLGPQNQTSGLLPELVPELDILNNYIAYHGDNNKKICPRIYGYQAYKASFR